MQLRSLPEKYVNFDGQVIMRDPETVCIPGDEINFLHYHNVCEVGICRCGSGLWVVGDSVTAIHPGDVMIVPPGVHHYSRKVEKVCQCEFIYFDEDQLFESCGIQKSVLKRLPKNFPSVIRDEKSRDISGAFGCTVRGVCMDGGRLGKNIHGIKLCWEKYNGGSKEDTPTVDDCRIGNFSGDGLHYEHAWCFSLRHSMIHSNRGAGLYIDGWDAFIIDNWFTGNANGGIMGGPVVASITCTGNRVEWNSRGGFVIPNGDRYNITGNFFDRSFGPALELGGEHGKVDLVTVTGNIFRRSGAYRDTPHENPDHSSHVILQNCSGTVVSGNTMRVGRNDGGGGVLSPDYSFIIADCRDCVIKDNTFHNGALIDNLVLRGDNSSCIIKDNIGSIAKA